MHRLSIIIGVVLVFFFSVIALEVIVRFVVIPRWQPLPMPFTIVRYILEPILAGLITCAWVWWTAGRRPGR